MIAHFPNQLFCSAKLLPRLIFSLRVDRQMRQCQIQSAISQATIYFEEFHRVTLGDLDRTENTIADFVPSAS
jgi:hypothetical protein